MFTNTILLLLSVYILSTAVTSFVEAGRYLLQYPGFKFLLSECFTQDPLEAFFSMQRQRGGGSDNPTALQFTYNTSSLRIQRSVAPSARSNVRVANMTEKRLWMIHLLPKGLEYQGVVSICNVVV